MSKINVGDIVTIADISILETDPRYISSMAYLANTRGKVIKAGGDSCLVEAFDKYTWYITDTSLTVYRTEYEKDLIDVYESALQSLVNYYTCNGMTCAYCAFKEFNATEYPCVHCVMNDDYNTKTLMYKEDEE